MDLDFLYELNSSQAAGVILDILESLNYDFKKNLEIIEKIIEFLENRDFKNPYSSIVGSLSNVNFKDLDKESRVLTLGETNKIKNILKLKQYVYERCQIAYLANKIGLGYSEKKCYNIKEYIDFIPVKGDLSDRLFSLDKDKIETFKKLKKLFVPKVGDLKLNIVGTKTRRFVERKYLIKNSLSVKIISYIYACLGGKYNNSVTLLSRDIFRFYMFLSLRERETSKVFPGICAVPNSDLLEFLNVPGIENPLEIINKKLLLEKIEKTSSYELGIKILYQEGIDKKVICELANIQEQDLNKLLNLNIAKTDRAKKFLEELL